MSVLQDIFGLVTKAFPLPGDFSVGADNGAWLAKLSPDAGNLIADVRNGKLLASEVAFLQSCCPDKDGRCCSAGAVEAGVAAYLPPEKIGDGTLIKALVAFIGSPAGQALIALLIGLIPKTAPGPRV